MCTTETSDPRKKKGQINLEVNRLQEVDSVRSESTSERFKKEEMGVPKSGTTNKEKDLEVSWVSSRHMKISQETTQT